MILAADIRAAHLVGPGIDPDAPLCETLSVSGPPEPDWQATTSCLPSRAARRLSPEIRLALAAAERIAPSLDPQAGWVFASSNGEGQTLDIILAALMTPDMLIQPTRFQNAVHNAASGQWTIAAKRTGPATSIAAFDDTAGAGLLKALLQLAREGREVGLVCYDVPLPPPLHEKRPIGAPLAVSLALCPVGGKRHLARLEALVDRGAPDSVAVTSAGTAMQSTGNPAAALLPLLERLAGMREDTVRLGLAGGSHLALSLTEPR